MMSLKDLRRELRVRGYKARTRKVQFRSLGYSPTRFLSVYTLGGKVVFENDDVISADTYDLHQSLFQFLRSLDDVWDLNEKPPIRVLWSYKVWRK